MIIGGDLFTIDADGNASSPIVGDLISETFDADGTPIRTYGPRTDGKTGPRTDGGNLAVSAGLPGILGSASSPNVVAYAIGGAAVGAVGAMFVGRSALAGAAVGAGLAGIYRYWGV